MDDAGRLTTVAHGGLQRLTDVEADVRLELGRALAVVAVAAQLDPHLTSRLTRLGARGPRGPRVPHQGCRHVTVTS